MRLLRLLVPLPLWVACQAARPIVAEAPVVAQPLAAAPALAPAAAPQTPDDPEERQAQEFFRQHYRYHQQPRSTGPRGVVRRKDELLVTYNRTDTLHIFNVDPVFYGLFTLGIIHPGQPVAPFHKVCNIKPLSIPTDSPQSRRYTLWHFNPKELNPEVYLFELTNAQATAATDQKTFIEGSTLTFMGRGWGIM